VHESGHGTKRHTLARASQLRGDLEAEGARLARRDVVVAVRRGPIALVEDILDIELCLPGRVESAHRRRRLHSARAARRATTAAERRNSVSEDYRRGFLGVDTYSCGGVLLRG